MLTKYQFLFVTIAAAIFSSPGVETQNSQTNSVAGEDMPQSAAALGSFQTFMVDEMPSELDSETSSARLAAEKAYPNIGFTARQKGVNEIVSFITDFLFTRDRYQRQWQKVFKLAYDAEIKDNFTGGVFSYDTVVTQLHFNDLKKPELTPAIKFSDGKILVSIQKFGLDINFRLKLLGKNYVSPNIPARVNVKCDNVDFHMAIVPKLGRKADSKQGKVVNEFSFDLENVSVQFKEKLKIDVSENVVGQLLFTVYNFIDSYMSTLLRTFIQGRVIAKISSFPTKLKPAIHEAIKIVLETLENAFQENLGVPLRAGKDFDIIRPSIVVQEGSISGGAGILLDVESAVRNSQKKGKNGEIIDGDEFFDAEEQLGNGERQDF